MIAICSCNSSWEMLRSMFPGAVAEVGRDEEDCRACCACAAMSLQDCDLGAGGGANCWDCRVMSLQTKKSFPPYFALCSNATHPLWPCATCVKGKWASAALLSPINRWWMMVMCTQAFWYCSSDPRKDIVLFPAVTKLLGSRRYPFESYSSSIQAVRQGLHPSTTTSIRCFPVCFSPAAWRTDHSSCILACRKEAAAQARQGE
mmetsp:Transcript_72225/g.157499  ORF Transcript_72225/g.157499 Transcript_72225/m.157499 type:complete len:203 (+) Transcript_72225:1245-1853(+)